MAEQMFRSLENATIAALPVPEMLRKTRHSKGKRYCSSIVGKGSHERWDGATFVWSPLRTKEFS